jgi:hypothetical protein
MKNNTAISPWARQHRQQRKIGGLQTLEVRRERAPDQTVLFPADDPATHLGYLGERYGVPSVLRVLRPGLAFLIEFMREPFIESPWVRKPVGFPLSRSFCRL